MLMDEIKTNEIYEMIKRRALDRESWRNWMPIMRYLGHGAKSGNYGN